MGATPKPYRVTPEGVLLTVRVTPNAGVDRLEGAETRADGQSVLRLRVAAVPDKGKANAAAVALLAGALDLHKSAFTFASGETARLKTLRIAGDGPRLARQIDELCS